MTFEGLSVDVPVGWEARIRLGHAVEEGAVRLPVLHAATRPLPSQRADYGGGVVESLEADDVFVSLVEFGEEAVGSNLFPVVDEIPRVRPEMFATSRLQRALPGQAGSQVFFTYHGRAFCLYIVVGSFGRRRAAVGRANQLVASLRID